MSTPSTAADRDTAGAPGEHKGGFVSRVLLFVRQVIDEMRKVVWPTRDELTQYSIVVMVFIVVVMLYVVGLDELWKRLVGWVFGSGS